MTTRSAWNLSAASIFFSARTQSTARLTRETTVMGSTGWDMMRASADVSDDL
ncbi:MAG: hypothetical protein LC795_11650 [Acidobacteria bacterium]|nr:hypothetical protein [Acidobacteriota bacterium]